MHPQTIVYTTTTDAEQLSGEDATSPLTVDIDSAATNLQLIDFKLPPPKELDEDGRGQVIGGSIKRIWEGAEELKLNGESISVDSTQAGGHSATEMWMLLLVRMVTRVTEPPRMVAEGDDMMDTEDSEVAVRDFYTRQDQLRQTLCDYIMSDFPARYVAYKLCVNKTQP